VLVTFAMLSIASEPSQVIPSISAEHRSILYSVSITALWYTLLHTGDFYYYFNLEEPYRSIKGFNISISLWLLANGLFGIQTAIFYVIYQWHRMLTTSVVPHLTWSVVVLYVFGLVWTITGWSCFYHIKTSYGSKEVFEYYMMFRVVVQSLLYVLGYRLIFQNE